MGLLIDLRGQRQGHRFWKRKLEIASKVTDPLSRAAWPNPPPVLFSHETAEKHFERTASKHREPHLFGASVSTEPSQNLTSALLPKIGHNPDKERLRERQRRYKQQLDAQIKALMNLRLEEKKAQSAGYNGGIFQRLGEHVIHDGKQSSSDLKKKMLEDLDEQIRLKEARLIAEYEAGQRSDAKTESELFWRSSPGMNEVDDVDAPRRFTVRSTAEPHAERIQAEARHPPWAVDKAETSRIYDYDQKARSGSGNHPSSSDSVYIRSSRPLFSESSERLDKILLDFLEEPIQF